MRNTSLTIQKKRGPQGIQGASPLNSIILALSCSFRLLLTLYAGLLVMLTLTDLLLDACLCAASLEAAKSAVK